MTDDLYASIPSIRDNWRDQRLLLLALLTHEQYHPKSGHCDSSENHTPNVHCPIVNHKCDHPQRKCHTST